MVLLTATGTRVVEDRRLAAGGEGEVFSVRVPQGMAFKRYFPTALDRDPHLADRVAAMVRQPPNSSIEGQSGHILLAWPREVVFDDSRFVGFLMPLIDATSTVELHRTTNPTDRGDATGDTAWLRGFTWQYLIRIAANLALATHAVHDTGAVIGDFNERNIRVSRQALVTLLDCDSMQIQEKSTGRTFLCHVGRPDFTAPELIGADWRTTVRRPSSDLFALAVHIYQLLLEGEHPFRGRWSGGGSKPTVPELARSGTWTHSGSPSLSPRPSAIGIEILPAEVRNLFRQAFEHGATDPDARPSAAQWYAALTRVQEKLARCRVRPEHFYPDTGAGCPWCARTSPRASTPPPAPRQQPLPPATAPTASPPPVRPWSTPAVRPPATPPGQTPATPSPRPAAVKPLVGGLAGRQGRPPAGITRASGSWRRSMPMLLVGALAVCCGVPLLSIAGAFVSRFSNEPDGTAPPPTAAAATAPLPTGTLVFSDDFSTDSGGWGEREDVGASATVNTAARRLDFSVQPGGIASTGPRLAEDVAAAGLRRVRMDVTMSTVSIPAGASFGIFCRVAPNRDSYAFHLMANGVSAVKYQAGESTSLSDTQVIPRDRRLRAECSTSAAGSAVDLRLWSGERLLMEVRDTMDVIRAGTPGGLRADLASDYDTDRFEIAVTRVAVYRL
ncbi:hypothetical protein ACIBJE_19485 [Micromonospora sp. NPDC050187]|uniref:hypothetical protein n=1 Tax=Micromonospora sp. NPDC050187 TaxID=3364277 RepID=UPI0037A76504